MNLSYLFSSILVTSVIAVAGCQSPKSAEENQQNAAELPATIDLLVGAYTGSGSNGIYQLQFDPATGQLSDSVLLVKTTNPSYLAISKDRQLVYSVNETGVSRYAVVEMLMRPARLNSAEITANGIFSIQVRNAFKRPK